MLELKTSYNQNLGVKSEIKTLLDLETKGHDFVFHRLKTIYIEVDLVTYNSSQNTLYLTEVKSSYTGLESFNNKSLFKLQSLSDYLWHKNIQSIAQIAVIFEGNIEYIELDS